MPAPVFIPPDDAEVVEQPVQKNTAFIPPDDAEPVKKKDVENSVSSSESETHGEPSEKSSGKSTLLTGEQRKKFQQIKAEKPKEQTPESYTKAFDKSVKAGENLKKAKAKDNSQAGPTIVRAELDKAQKESEAAQSELTSLGLNADIKKPSEDTDDPITAFSNTILSGLTDQLPKEYYTQRLRMSKGSFGDLFDPRSDLNAFGDKLPTEISRDEFRKWNNKQESDIRTKTYDERAKLFLTEKLGTKGYEDLKAKFKEDNTKERLGFEQEIQQQNREAQQKTSGVVQTIGDIKGAGDLLNFSGNMIGQMFYRVPITLLSGPTGSIISESASVYDTQLDLIAEKHGISREEVIKRELDDPAAAQSLAVLLGTMDAMSSFNILGMFKKAAGKKLSESVVKQFLKGGVPEGLTETIQTEGEQFAAASGAGTEYNFDWNRAGTSFAGGVIGGGAGGAMSAVSNNTQNKVETIASKVTDLKSAEEAAKEIEKVVTEPEKTEPPAATTTEPIEQPTAKVTTVVDEGPSTEPIQQNEPQETTPPTETSGQSIEQPGQGTENIEGTPIVTEGDQSIETQTTTTNEGAVPTVNPRADEKTKTFKIGDQDVFYHASERKRKGRLRPNEAKQFGTAVYFSTDKKTVEHEFGDGNTTEVKLNITNPVYTNSPEWKKLKDEIAKKWSKKTGRDIDDFDYNEVPAKYISDTAKEMGYDAIIDEADTYGNEIAVLDESKIVYPEDESSFNNQSDPRADAKAKLQALAESGDISFDGNKVTVLTEKGGQEAFRIKQELDEQLSKSPTTETTQQQPSGNEQTPPATDTTQSTESVPGQTETTGDDGSQPPPIDDSVTSQPEEEQVSGIKKALVPLEKVEATDIEKRSTEQMLEDARRRVNNGEVNPKSIVDEIADGKARALQPDEVSALVYYKTQLDNRATQVSNKLNEAIERGDFDAQATLKAELDAINNEVDRYHTMSLKTAYEQSLAFRLRQMLLDSEYNLADQVARFKAANDGFIDDDTMKRFEELDQQMKAANAKIAELEEQARKRDEEIAAEALRIVAEKEKAQRRKLITDEKKKKIADAFDKLKIQGGTVGELNNIFQVVGAPIWNGAMDAIKTAVLAGVDATNAVQAGIDYIQKNFKGQGFNPEEFKNAIGPSVEALVPKTQQQKDSSTDKSSGVPYVNEDGKIIIPNKFIREVVAGGATKIDEVTKITFDLLKQDFPDVTERQVRDAITEYGKTRMMSQDDISKKVREIKRTGRLISALEDVKQKIRPLRTGLQRDKLTDQERRMQKEVKELMKDLPVDEAEVQKAWRTALDQVKARLQNQIKDIEEQIKTGKKPVKSKKGLQYDQEAKDLQAKRDKLKEVLNQIEGKPGLSEEQRLRNALSAIERGIREYTRRIEGRDFSAKVKTTLKETPEITAAKKKREDLRKVYEDLRKEAGIPEKLRLENYKKAIRKSIQGLEDRITNKDFAPRQKSAPPVDDEIKKLIAEKERVKEKFDVEQEKNRLANRTPAQKFYETMVDLINLPKSFFSTLDMSAPFRQGFILSASNPSSVPGATKEMFSQAFSKKKADEWMDALKSTDAYPVMRKSGLYLAEPNAKLQAKEESFISNLAKKIPVYGQLVGGSERAYTAYLNKLRSDVFVAGMDKMMDQGITPESNPDAYKAWATFINNATGRGEFNSKTIENALPLLNGLMFSPRYLASRVNLLGNLVSGGATMPAPVRKMAMRSLLSYVGLAAAILTLAAGAGAEVEKDPRSSDFAKIKVGDTRYDVLAGFQQVIRFIAQFTTGQRKTKQGIEELDGEGPFGETRMDVLARFARTKASPIAGSTWNLLEGRDMVGGEANVKTEAKRLVTPGVLQTEFDDILKSQGELSLISSIIASFFGIGVQHYAPKKKKEKKESLIRDLNTDNMFRKIE